MPETYRESAEGLVIGRARAVRELRAHGVTVGSDDMAECLAYAWIGVLGDGSPVFDAGRLLDWLGY